MRELRKGRNWTLEQAAQQAGLARSTLSKIENGQMSPTYDALKKLAEGLQISVPQLFTPPQREKVNGRMVMTPFGYKGPGACIMNSRHRDGALISRAIERLGVEVVHGSSSRGWVGGRMRPRRCGPPSST